MSKKNPGSLAKKSAPRKPIVKEESINEVLTIDPVEETLEPIVNDSPEAPVSETPEPIIERKVRVFWHKACSDEKSTTLTTLKPDEVLTKTNLSLTGPEGHVKDVYSLKRGKRIYYLLDVTPQDITRAFQKAKEKLEASK